MNLERTRVGIALTVVLATARLGSSGPQDASSPAELSPQRVELAESILAAKERALGEPMAAAIRASLKGRMETLSMERLRALLEQGDTADLPSVLGSVTSELVYTPVTPCRVFDSRVSQGGPGPIAANGQWNVIVAGTLGFPAQGGFSGGCGVPVGATSAIINFVTVLPGGPGNIRAWAVADPQPPAPLAAIMNYGPVVGLPAIANGVAVPLCNPAATSCAAGDLRLQADTSGTNILGDVVGYFGPAVGGFMDLSTAQTVGGVKTFSSPIAGSVTGSAASVTGIVPIANGGTGSATQNFVDLTNSQTVGGNKTLTGNLVLGTSTATRGNILKGPNRFIHNFGGFNTFIGENAGNFTMTGIYNTASGWEALRDNTIGTANTASGVWALVSNTTGDFNTANGEAALAFNTTGGLNTANGARALLSNTTGHSNTASGQSALFFNTTGDSNTASGQSALEGNTTGSKNVAVGLGALNTQSFSNGGTAWDSFNTAVGYRALFANQPISTATAQSNTALGASALSSNTTGSYNTAIGSGANVSTGALSNATAIGNGATVDASNKIRLGNSDVTVIEGQVAYTFPSDRTRKENLRDVNAQEILEKLRGMSVTTWNYIGHDSKEFRHYGPMAQDFFAAFGRDEVGAIGTDTTINLGDITGILMIGLKGLDARVLKDQRTIAAQAARIVDLERQMAEVADLKRQLAVVMESVKALSPSASRGPRLTSETGDAVPPSGR